MKQNESCEKIESSPIETALARPVTAFVYQESRLLVLGRKEGVG
jgi:hypothetical protein